MITELDAAFRAAIDALRPADDPTPATTVDDPELALDYFRAQLRSRHLDFAARRLQSIGEGFYTIGSAGHESNAAVALAMRPTDPALLHYRSGAFYCARAGQVTAHDPVADIVASVTASVSDPISGGRHKVFGHPGLHVIPQTSTIASHLPRAVGLAFALHRSRRIGMPSPWPADAVVVASLGDASLNHSTATAPPPRTAGSRQPSARVRDWPTTPPTGLNRLTCWPPRAWQPTRYAADECRPFSISAPSGLVATPVQTPNSATERPRRLPPTITAIR